MFWGLMLESKKRYVQKVEKGFRVSQAALDISASEDSAVKVNVSCNGQNHVLCTLQKPGILQCGLDLKFAVGDEIYFSIDGKGTVHLSGYMLNALDEVSKENITLVKKKRKVSSVGKPSKKSKTEQLLDDADDYDSEDDSTFNLDEFKEDVDDEEEGTEDSDEDDKEGSEEQSDEEEEEEEAIVGNEDEESGLSEDEDKVEIVEVVKKSPVNGISLQTKREKRKLKEQTKKEQKHMNKTSTTPTHATPKSTLKTDSSEHDPNSQMRTLEGGVVVQDLKVGQGPIAKSGKVVQVYYEGRLKHSNKMFDSNKQGPGFKFRLGKQEVIKGWEVGVLGMRVGGKRRITCPPQMAYGQKGSPPVIPPNAPLVFEVEVKKVT